MRRAAITALVVLLGAGTAAAQTPRYALLLKGGHVIDARNGVTEQTYYRWRKEFGGLKTDQVKRLKELEKENERLRKAVSDLTLEKLILREAASGNF